MTGVRILGAAKASVINMLEPATGVVFGVIYLRKNVVKNNDWLCLHTGIHPDYGLARDSRKRWR